MVARFNLFNLNGQSESITSTAKLAGTNHIEKSMNTSTFLVSGEELKLRVNGPLGKKENFVPFIAILRPVYDCMA